MISHDKAVNLLVELGCRGARRTPAETMELALRAALMLADSDAAVVFSNHHRGGRLALHKGSSTTALLPVPPEGSEVIRRLAANARPLVLSDLSEESALAALDGCPGVVAGPATFAGLGPLNPATGYLAVYRGHGHGRYAVNDVRLMLLLAAWLGATLDGSRLSAGQEKSVLTDDLTELYNARFLRSALRRELRRAARFGQDLTVVLLEVDQFATWDAGERDARAGTLLREAASVVGGQLRSFDLLARFRGLELMLVLPQTDSRGAAEVVERVRAAVAEHTFAGMAPGAMTVSAGVASSPGDASDLRGLFAAAERALAQARPAARVGLVGSRSSRAA